MNEKTGSSPLKAITRIVELLMEQYDGEMPSIRQVDSAASPAKFPVTRVNGRRFVTEDNLPKVAAAFGLTRKAASPTKTARKALAVPVCVAA